MNVIQQAGIRGIYKANGYATGGCEQRPAAKTEWARKTDTVSISRIGSLSRELGKASQDITGELEASCSGRVEQIRAAIENKTYFVSSEQLADAILARALGA